MGRGNLINKLEKIISVLEQEGESYISELYEKCGYKKGYQSVMASYLILLTLYNIVKWRKLGSAVMFSLTENYKENFEKLKRDLEEKTWIE